MERNGVPIDVGTLDRLQSAIGRTFRISSSPTLMPTTVCYEGRTFKADRFAAWLAAQRTFRGRALKAVGSI